MRMLKIAQAQMDEAIENNDMAGMHVPWVDWSGNQEVGNNLEASGAVK